MSQGLCPPSQLRAEYQTDPLGLDETEPRFSWQVNDNRRGARQISYQVLVASSIDRLNANEGDLWDSGCCDSESTVHVVYGGLPLRSFSKAAWKVRTWGADGHPSQWSDPACFELGPLTAADWSGSWFIRSHLVGDAEAGAPSPFLRRRFHVEGPIERARLYVTALGLYEASINGNLVSDELYRPGWTDYHRRVPYQAYDVTDLLEEGENVIGAVLGDGWYCGFIADRRQWYGDRPRFLAKLVVELSDGTEGVVGSDDEWRTISGPILGADNYHGETYDARLELPGWDTPTFDDSAWDPVEVVGHSITWGRIELVGTTAPPMRRILELAPETVIEREPGVVQFDFGQNMVGWVRLRVSASAGTRLTMRFAEMLNDDGTLHTANLNTARATDTYVCRGSGEEVYEPRFTFHGFRYVEIVGPANLSLDSVTGLVVHSDADIVGDFTCSNPLIDRLFRNIQWSQRGNFLDVPTDCPQRSERLGWTGDIQVFARTATFNMDVASFLTKYTADLRDAQLQTGIESGSFPMVAPSIGARAGGPGWADAGVIVPWILYERYGDLRLLERHYPSIRGYVGFLERVHGGLAEGAWLGFGDWLSIDPEPLLVHDMGATHTIDFGGTPRDYLWRCFDVYSTSLAAKIASLLGEATDATRFARHAESARKELVERYIDPRGHLTVTTQTAYLLALHFDLLIDPEHRKTAAADLVANLQSVGHLQTGFIGTPYLLPVLSEIGRSDLAYRLLERTDHPGWLYPVTQGATTIWERWDAWTADEGFFGRHVFTSFNHYAYGAVGEWLFRKVAGIDTTVDGAGYRHILIHPELGGSLTWARASLETIRGPVSTEWHLESGIATLNIVIPVNTIATLRLPATRRKSITEEGIPLAEVEGISDVVLSDGRVECRALAGNYHLRIDRPVIAK